MKTEENICKSCGEKMKLMRVSPDNVKWRDAYVCMGSKIGCGVKELSKK